MLGAQEALERGVAEQSELSGRLQADRQSLSAVNIDIARWEREAGQYSEVRRSIGPLLQAELDKQREWQRAALQHISATNRADKSREAR